MSDLDHLLDAFVGNVRSQTRAPGAALAIDRARRRRKTTAAAAAVAVAVAALIAAGSVLVAGTLGGGEGRASLAGPPTASPEASAGQSEASVGERFQTLRRALTAAPGWTVIEPDRADPTSAERCTGNWMDGPGGRGAGHNLGLSVRPDESPVASAEEVEGFLSPAQASEAMARLISNLESCTAASWSSRPIGDTGAVLAHSDALVLWIHQRDGHVATLTVGTTDGPPPVAIQVEVADLIYSWFCTDCDDWHDR